MQNSRMSADTQQIISPRPTYYVMNMRNEHWVQISDAYFNLDEAKQAYTYLLKKYSFARLGGSHKPAVREKH